MANLLHDVIDRGNDAFDRGYDRTQKLFDQAARRKAGRALASGDEAAAAAAAYDGGLIDEGAAIERRGVEAEQRQYERGRTEKADEIAEATRRGEALVKVAQALKGVPPEQRHDRLQQIAPAFQGIGIDPAPFLALTPEQLSNDALDMFSGEIKEHIKTFSSGGRTVAIDEGALKRDFSDPNAVRVLDEDPLAREYQRSRIEATDAMVPQRQASAEASRARAYRTMHPVAKGGAQPSGSSPTLRAIEAALRKRGKL